MTRATTNAASLRKPMNMYALFAGGGGLHLGFEQMGFKLALATDIEPAAQRTHNLNSPDVPFLLGDVRKFSANDLLNAASGVAPDLIVGGPPCQGFSTLEPDPKLS